MIATYDVPTAHGRVPVVMADETINKKKLPRDVQHLLSIEDHLKKIEGIIRDIRLGMTNAGMPTVELATGTMFHYLGLAEGFAEKFKGEFNTQKAAHTAKQAREQIKAQRASDDKTRRRK